MITMTFRQFTSPSFWQSFRSLSGIKQLAPQDKLNVYRLDKLMKDEIEVARGTIGEDKEGVDEIMSQVVEFNIEFSFTAETLVKELTALDLINLEQLLTKEES